MNIYEIKESYEQLQQFMADGLVDDEVFRDTLESIEGNLEEKLEGYGLVIKNIEALANGYKAEADRLNNRHKEVVANIDKLKDRISVTLQTMNIPKMDTEHFRYSFRKSDSLNVFDESKIPDQFIKSEVVTSVNKADLKKAMKGGLVVNGAEIIERQNLQFK